MTEPSQLSAQIVTNAVTASDVAASTFESKFVDFVFSSPAMVVEIKKRITIANPNETLENQLHAILDGQRSEMFVLLHKWIGVEGIMDELLEDGADADKIIEVLIDTNQDFDSLNILSSLNSDEIFEWVTDNLKGELEDWVNTNGEIRSFEIRL
jgi:hypothetical protein